MLDFIASNTATRFSFLSLMRVQSSIHASRNFFFIVYRMAILSSLKARESRGNEGTRGERGLSKFLGAKAHAAGELKWDCYFFFLFLRLKFPLL